MVGLRTILVGAALLVACAAPGAAQTVESTLGLLAYPELPVAQDPQFNTLVIDASGERVACVFRVPETGTLDKFEFMTGAVTAADDVRVSFQDLDASGDPDTTQDQYRDIAAASITANTWIVPGLMTSDGTDGGVKRSVTRGDRMALVIEIATYVDGNFAVNTVNSTAGQTLADFYADHFTAAWAKQARPCNVALKYNGGHYAHVGAHWQAISTALPESVSISTSTTPNEAGNIVTMAFKASVGGAWLVVDLDQDGEVVLYDSDGTTALATVALDSSNRSGTAAGLSLVRFASSVTLDVDTAYRIVFKPSTTSAINLRQFSVNAADNMGAFVGGENVHKTSRTDAGAWTEDTTKRVYIGLMIDGLGDNTCSGGGGGNCVVR